MSQSAVAAGESLTGTFAATVSDKSNAIEARDERSEAVVCAHCGRPAVAMHAIPSFQHPEEVVLVCDEHEAGGERTELATVAQPEAPAARSTTLPSQRLETLGVATRYVGDFVLVVVAAVAVLALVAFLLGTAHAF